MSYIAYGRVIPDKIVTEDKLTMSQEIKLQTKIWESRVKQNKDGTLNKNGEKNTVDVIENAEHSDINWFSKTVIGGDS